MSDISTIFKAYDVRGKVGTELNADVARSIGKAFAGWLPTEGPVAVGRDMRPDSAELASALIEGIRSQGRDVIDIGLITSDMVYFATGNYNLAGGAVVTASHNPGEYNGIKFCGREAKAIGQDSGLFEIRDLAASGSYAPSSTTGSLEEREISEDWITHVLGFIDTTKLTPMKLAVDAGNGMAGKIFPELEPFVPWDVSELYFELDGTFPNHEANPMKTETLTEMIKLIKEKELDGGMAFDGDGDRAFLVDETGTVLTGGVMSALLADYFLELNPNANIVVDIRNSHSVLDVVKESGGTAVQTRVGHSFIKQVMREKDAPFGGEASGHFYFRDNWYADSGLIAAVIGVYVATISGRKLSEIRKQYTRYAAIPETNFVTEQKDRIIEDLKKMFADSEQSTLDGLTVTIDKDTWFNVRASNTEPVIRLNAEAKSEPALKALVEKVTAIIAE